MKLSQRIVGLVLGTTVLATLAAVNAGSALAAAPPWEPDVNSIGIVTLYNAAGAVITGGNLSDVPFAAYAQASSAGRVGDTKATLIGKTPNHSQPTGAWSGQQLSASTTYPNAAAPAPLKTSPLPVASLGVGDGDLTSYIQAFPNNDSTAGYVNVYQLRIITSGPGLPVPTTYYTADISVNSAAGTWTQVYPAPVVAVPAKYATVTPCRVFDTRQATPTACSGAVAVAKAPLGAGATLSVKVAGVGGVPADATAVVMNLTAVGATRATYVTAWGHGGSRPGVSNLNVNNGQAVPNLAIVPVGTGGLIDLYNAQGAVNLIGDVAGYFSASATSANTTVTPCRVFDTRQVAATSCANAVAVGQAKVGQGGVVNVKVAGVGGVPANATAVVLNLTAVGASRATYVTAWPHGVAQPVVSNLNVNNGQAVPNLAIVPIGTDGTIDLFNAQGSIDLIGDVAGYFAAGAGASNTTVTPCRVFDTRFTTPGSCSAAVAVGKAKLGAGGILNVKVAGVGGVPANATAVVLNLTAVGASRATYVTAWPHGVAQPGVSNLNVNNGQAVPNLAIVPIGSDGTIDLYNAQGTIDLIGDVAGYFAP